jgi:hypothetical protein
MIIGISGLAGSGKDTCADFLVRNHDFVKVSFADPMKRICRDVYGFSFDQMWGPSEARNAPDERYQREHTWKAEHSGSTHVGDVDVCRCCNAVWSQSVTPCRLTPRFALQQLGSEWARVCYPSTWVDYALNVAKKLSVEGGYNYKAIHGLSHDWHPGDENWTYGVVIPDVRFKNELEAIRAHGGKLIRVVRQNAGLKGSAGQHRSETEQLSMPDELFDGVIVNSGTLLELEEMVTNFAEKWAGE